MMLESHQLTRSDKGDAHRVACSNVALRLAPGIGGAHRAGPANTDASLASSRRSTGPTHFTVSPCHEVRAVDPCIERHAGPMSNACSPMAIFSAMSLGDRARLAKGLFAHCARLVERGEDPHQRLHRARELAGLGAWRAELALRAASSKCFSHLGWRATRPPELPPGAGSEGRPRRRDRCRRLRYRLRRKCTCRRADRARGVVPCPASVLPRDIHGYLLYRQPAPRVDGAERTTRGVFGFHHPARRGARASTNVARVAFRVAHVSSASAGKARKAVCPRLCCPWPPERASPKTDRMTCG